MKITINQKQTKPKEINWKELPVGTMVEFDDGVRALVYREKTDCTGGPALLLLAPERGFHLEQAKGYLAFDIHQVVKVVGIISEIIVEAE